MKHSAEYKRFTALVDQVLSVPHSVIKQRLKEYKEQVAKNPKRRGPKRKATKPSADHAASDL